MLTREQKPKSQKHKWRGSSPVFHKVLWFMPYSNTPPASFCRLLPLFLLSWCENKKITSGLLLWTERPFKRFSSNAAILSYRLTGEPKDIPEKIQHVNQIKSRLHSAADTDSWRPDGRAVIPVKQGLYGWKKYNGNDHSAVGSPAVCVCVCSGVWSGLCTALKSAWSPPGPV